MNRELRATFQPHLVDGHIVVEKQYNAQPSALVVPPSARWVRWCTSHAEASWSQPPTNRLRPAY